MEIIRRIVNSVPTANQLEHDLREIWNEMKVQSNIAATVRNQLQHETTGESWSTAGAGERTLLLTRILSTANSAKESFLRLGAMYALTDRMYDQQVFSGCIDRDRRDQWLQYRDGEFSVSWVMRALNTEMEKLSSTIELTSELLVVAEKELREQESMFSCFRGSLHKSERSESKAVSRVTEMLEKQQDIIRNLSARIEAMETDKADDPPSPAENPAPKKTEDSATSSSVLQVKELTDDEYFSKMLEEVQGDSEDSLQISEQPLVEPRWSVVEPRWSSCRVQSSHGELRAEIQRLETQVAAMERDMSSYPYRTITFISRGISPEIQCRFCGLEGTHLSDACPTVVTSLQRSLVLMQKDLCFWCLDSCGGQNCRSKDKLCFYCKHLHGTVFENEIPDDGGHHRAICPVPEKKGLMKQRIQRLKERLQELKKEEETFPRGECRDKTT